MADNVAITAGSGTTIATDDIGGVHYQIVKIAGGALDTANLQKVNANGSAYVILTDASGTEVSPVSKNENDAASGGAAGQPAFGVYRSAKTAPNGVTGDYTWLSINGVGDLRVDGGQVYAFENAPTVTAGAYSANDCVGGEIEITNAARATGAGGIITHVVMAVEDDSSNGVAANDYEVWFFKSNPAGTYTDNTALAVTDADAFELEAIITLDEKYSGGNVSILQAKNLNVGYICDATSLWAVVVDRTGNTLEATDAVQLRFKMIRD